MDYRMKINQEVLLHYVSYEYYSALNLLPPHVHLFPTIMFVDKLIGSCEYQIGKKVFPIRQGDILLINPGIYHSKNLIPGLEIHEVHLAFENLQFEGFSPNHIVRQDDFMVVPISEHEVNLYTQAVQILNHEADFDQQHGDIVALSLFYQFLAIALRSITATQDIGPLDTQALAYYSSNHDNVAGFLREFLIENYTHNITLSVVAKRMYLSTEYLSRLFKAEVGKSPYTFLIELRINKAKDLLETTNATIHSIALQVGYSDAYHFSKQFKKVASVSPSEYRKKYRTADTKGDAI